MEQYRYSRLDPHHNAEDVEQQTLVDEGLVQQSPAVGLHHEDFDSRVLVVTCLVIFVPALTGLVWWLTS